MPLWLPPFGSLDPLLARIHLQDLALKHEILRRQLRTIRKLQSTLLSSLASLHSRCYIERKAKRTLTHETGRDRLTRQGDRNVNTPFRLGSSRFLAREGSDRYPARIFHRPAL